MTPTLPALAIAAGAGILAVLGTLHVYLTIIGGKLHPRDPTLSAAMDRTPMVLTPATTVWRAWLGFNVSHGLGAMLFGALYLHLALMQPQLLRDSSVLTVVGAAYLAAMTALAWRYWFRTPFLGVLAATVLYAAGMIGLHLQG